MGGLRKRGAGMARMNYTRAQGEGHSIDDFRNAKYKSLSKKPRPGIKDMLDNCFRHIHKFSPGQKEQITDFHSRLGTDTGFSNVDINALISFSRKATRVRY